MILPDLMLYSCLIDMFTFEQVETLFAESEPSFLYSREN